MEVIELEKARLVQRSSERVTLEVSVTVVTETSAGSAEIAYFVATPPSLDANDYPTLAAIWNNDEDAIFDTL
ncbi:MAG: hypothetical protein ACYC9X_04900 [Dehalococcoidia bacterium]